MADSVSICEVLQAYMPYCVYKEPCLSSPYVCSFTTSSFVIVDAAEGRQLSSHTTDMRALFHRGTYPGKHCTRCTFSVVLQKSFCARAAQNSRPTALKGT